jgi:hypothetical protein
MQIPKGLASFPSFFSSKSTMQGCGGKGQMARRAATKNRGSMKAPRPNQLKTSSGSDPMHHRMCVCVGPLSLVSAALFNGRPRLEP